MYTRQTYYLSSSITIAYDAHGILGGASTWARGGNFSIGFASGAVASSITSCTEDLVDKLPTGWKITCMVAAGGLSGGVTASMAGGSFWDGVCNGLICSGLNHALHLAVGPLNKGLAIAMVTGRIRHMFGPDAIAGAITMDANSGIALSAEGGGLYVLVGKDKGFYSYADLGAGAGLVSVSAGVEFVELYSSSATSEVSVNDFTGPRLEGNYSVTAFGMNVGATAIYSERYDANGVKTGYTIGIGPTVGVDAIPFKVGGNVNYGASSTEGIRGLSDGLNRAFRFKLKQP
ncbi:MAG: hypothetical protein F083_2118 [bacterium F083]|nr:MAG: hypothetical protein F083_2118 [bacterium F083]